MTDSHSTDLVYGHLGEPRYVSELKKWEFARVPEHRHQLEQISLSKVTLPATSEHQDSRDTHLAASRNLEIKLLGASDPFLTPAASHLAPLAQVSGIVNDSVAAYDPLIGDLLAFGKAKFQEPHPGTKSVGIVAAVAGASGESVRLVRLVKKRVRSSASEDIALDVSTLEGGESSVWIGPGSPIQQICFSVSSGRSSSLLAVRTLLGVVILRPVIRHDPAPAPSFNGFTHQSRSHPASRLDPNPIITILLQDVADVPFSDVTFNPWFDEQFGIIDQQGQWAVFEIDREQGVKRLFLKIIPHHHCNGNQGAFNNCWAKLLWVADVNTVALAQRHCLKVYDIKSRTPIAVDTFQTSFMTDRILDVMRDLRNHSMLYLLTSTKVFWIEVQAASEGSKNNPASTRVLLSLWHYRSFYDLSLRLSMTEQGDSILLLIWSQAATLVTVFTLGLSSNRTAQQLGLDTLSFFPHLDSGVVDQKRALQNTGYRALHLRKARAVSNPIAQFFQLFLLDPILNVSESFHQHVLPQERALKLGDTVPLGQAKVNLKSSVGVQDSFLVPDALCSEDEQSSNDNAQLTWPTKSSKKLKSDQFEDPFTFSNEWLTRTLNRAVTDVSSSAASAAFQSRANLFNHLKAFAANTFNGSEVGIRLLIDAFEDQLNISDLDSTSQSLHSFLRRTIRTGLLEDELSSDIDSLPLRCEVLNIHSLSSITLRHSSQTDDMGLVDIHNRFVKYWVTSLPSKTPSRIRINLNRILRIIALQVYLSTHGIKYTAPGLPAEPELPQLGMAIDFPALAVRSKAPITPESSQAAKELKGEEEKSQQEQSHPINLPEASLPTPALSRAASSQRSISLNATVPDEAYTRLSALAHLDFQPALQSIGQRLLSHWEVGVDPSAYDWVAKKELHEQEDLDAQIAGDPKALKQKRRREKRLKRHLESSQRAVASSSQHPPMSLPTAPLPGGEIRSDPFERSNPGLLSQNNQGPVPFTQEEPGRFGARPEKKNAVKPSRRQGF